MTDSLGNLLAIYVHAANVHDTVAGIWAAWFALAWYSSIQKFCGDLGYRGTFVDNVRQFMHLDVDISERIKPKEWKVAKWRWVVERTFSWLNHSRRLAKDFEITTDSQECMVKISHIHTLLKRL